MRVGKEKASGVRGGYICNAKESEESKDIETLKKLGNERFMNLGIAPLER